MSMLLEPHNSYSDSASLVSTSESIFEEAPESPISWRSIACSFDHSEPKSLQTRLQTYALEEPRMVEKVQNTEVLFKSHSLLPNALPNAGEAEKVPIVTETRGHQTENLLKMYESLLKFSWRQSRILMSHPVLKPAVLRAPLALLAVPRAPTTSILMRGSKSKLKINVRSPDEDEILAIRIHKDKLQSVRELADVVMIKLNVRFCLRPNDLQCFLVFPGKSLAPVELGSSDVSLLLEDFIMEYILSRPKIYIEARLKADRKRL